MRHRKPTEDKITDFHSDLAGWIMEQTTAPPHKLVMVLVPKKWFSALIPCCDADMRLFGIEIQQNDKVTKPTPLWDNRYCVRISNV